MPSMNDDGGESDDRPVSPIRVGIALSAVGTVWIALAVALRVSPIEPYRLFGWSSALSLYPGGAARLLDTDIVGVVTVAVGLCVVGLATTGDRGDDSTTDGAAIRFRTALAVAAVGFGLAVATLPVGPPPSGPINGPPVTRWLVEIRFLLAYLSVWPLPLGIAGDRRERAIAGAGIAVVPVAALGFAITLIGTQAGLAVLVGFFAVSASLALIAVAAVYGYPLYLAGRILGGHAAPEWLPTAWYRNG